VTIIGIILACYQALTPNLAECHNPHHKHSVERSISDSVDLTDWWGIHLRNSVFNRKK